MNTKQAMMLTALTAQQQSADDQNESVAFVAFQAFMKKETYRQQDPFERIYYPVFMNVHHISAIQPSTNDQYAKVSQDEMVVTKRNGGWYLVTVDEANKLIAHIRKLQGY